MSDYLDLGVEGKVALITGANGGIGLETVKAFIAAKIKVVATDINIQAIQNQFPEESDDLLIIKEDISQVQACRDLVSNTIKHFGQINILVNCAAIITRLDVDKVDEKLWDRHMAINLKSVFFLTRCASKDMRKRNWGRIINLTSQAGHTGGAVDCLPYASSKGGINTMTKSFAKYLAPYGVTVNSVSPGLVDTQMITGTLDENTLTNLVESIPIKRLSRVNEISLPVLFLTSRWADSITGLTLDVNGGMLMR